MIEVVFDFATELGGQVNHVWSMSDQEGRGLRTARKRPACTKWAAQRPGAPAAIPLRFIAVGCSALLGLVIMFHSYDYFSSGVSFFIVPENSGPAKLDT